MATELKPEIKDGMSQSERYLASLDTSYFGIDEKDAPDLFKLLYELCGQFNYYDETNHIQGDWQDFLSSDIDILIELLASVESRTSTDQYKKLTHALKLAENQQDLTICLRNIFLFIQGFAILQMEFHKRLETANNLGRTNHFDLTKETFAHHLQRLYDYNLNAIELLGEAVRIHFEEQSFSYIFERDFEVIDEPFHKNGSVREKVILSVPYFDNLVADLEAKFNKLSNTARQYIKTQIVDGDVFDPHTALLLSFLKLYTYLQQPVNHLLQKHLDYFYHDIIGIKNKEEQLDKMHLIVGPIPLSTPFVLNKGEQLIAEVEGYQEKLIYALANDTEISATQVRELKTVFISNKLQLKGRTSSAGDVNELQIYQGNYPSAVPDTFQKDGISFPWPLLGEDQSELPLQQKTMDQADIGLMVASPLLYQVDGQRNFSVKFFIKQESCLKFDEHVTRMYKALNTNKEVLILQLLNQSFDITITGANGWLPIKHYAVSFTPASTTSSCCMEIKFRMKSTEEAIAIYNPALHGQDLGLQLPALRLSLNNYSFHHPYTFLSYFVIERVNIKVDVRESEHFKLRNNQFDLHGKAPFQPFGALPVRGSYLDIHNSNIFNSYLVNFRLQFYWFDLPADENGFEDYYQGYPYPFTNDSFKITLSSNTNSRFTPGTEEKQEFNLFERQSPHGKALLKNRTTINRIDLKRIKFENMPELDKDDTNDDFKQGTLRVELVQPDDAFGNRLYTRSFIEIAEHNAKRFVKKKDAPNPPYVPVLKSMSIDYTLEHSELIYGSTQENRDDLVLFHLYPFGYEEFYNGKNLKNNFFVPPPNHESNLFLGLSELTENQELSLLFQLAEANLHHSMHEPELINWSHLVQNKWVPFPNSGVLMDTTNNFMNTGVVTLKIPEGVDKGNTILNADLYWIRASLPCASSLKSRTIAIFSQAVIAVREPGQSNFPDSAYILPKDAVKGFRGSLPAVKSLMQFFPSFGGYPKESDGKYNIRVSERLRHKQRLLSVLDICQAVLDAFPQIMMVKCYGTTDNEAVILPGIDIHLIVIPKEREDGSFISQEPRVSLSLLYAIKKFVTGSVSDFIRIEVGNPIYERVMVVAKVKFKAAGNTLQSDGYYIKQLNQDINKYISAWLYDAKADFKMGSKIYILEILNHLQHQPYIEYITGFSLVHFFKVWNQKEGRFDAQLIDTSIDLTDSLQGSVAGAILIPADDHQLKVIREHKPEEPVKSGIGDFSIGSDLLVLQSPETSTVAGNPVVKEELYDFTIYPH
ncbi:hypothetical protein HDF26_001699 [Pedobacter cryoconitis]|uniref:hypothetical protein n=1 Tax=Pedobacter cryoconitis TaxID=188932 RepID=UPI00161CDDC9|nr:hypothetical protein [Pedobacter cryoconitis]MBB6271272.1 hypothetical protein [Pedobacter cryoconitis]